MQRCPAASWGFIPSPVPRGVSVGLQCSRPIHTRGSAGGKDSGEDRGCEFGPPSREEEGLIQQRIRFMLYLRSPSCQDLLPARILRRLLPLVLLHHLQHVLQDGRPQIHVEGEEGAGVREEGLGAALLLRETVLWAAGTRDGSGGGGSFVIQVEPWGLWGCLGGRKGQSLRPPDDGQRNGVFEEGRGGFGRLLAAGDGGRPGELEGSGLGAVLVGMEAALGPGEEVEFPLEEGDVPKHVAFAATADVDGVAEVPQRGADHVGREDVAELLLLALPAAPLQVDGRLGGHGGGSRLTD